MGKTGGSLWGESMPNVRKLRGRISHIGGCENLECRRNQILELMADNVAARDVNEHDLVTFKISWQAGGWLGEWRCGRGTNASMTYLRGRTCDCESPSDEAQRRGEEGTKERERLKVWGEHMTRWRCVWTRMGFCAADNLNATNSTWFVFKFGKG